MSGKVEFFLFTFNSNLFYFLLVKVRSLLDFTLFCETLVFNLSNPETNEFGYKKKAGQRPAFFYI